MQVCLNVYDVPGGTEQIDSVIQRLNEWGRLAGFGGVFHGAVELDGCEWSFGGCATGSGVYSFEPRKNPMYKYRETVDLGSTQKSKQEVRQILKRLKREWMGNTYELLSRNCCHFCQAFAQELEVTPVPGWLNRAAASADAAVTLSNKAYSVGSSVSSNISRTATTSYGWLCNSINGLLQQQQHQQDDNPQSQADSSEEEGFFRHFSFSGGGQSKPPAKAIWEGGIVQGSPLHAALEQPRDPDLSGIAHLPPHLVSVPNAIISLPPTPQDPPERGAPKDGTALAAERPLPGLHSAAPALPAWLPQRIAGGLQTAYTAAAGALKSGHGIKGPPHTADSGTYLVEDGLWSAGAAGAAKSIQQRRSTSASTSRGPAGLMAEAEQPQGGRSISDTETKLVTEGVEAEGLRRAQEHLAVEVSDGKPEPARNGQQNDQKPQETGQGVDLLGLEVNLIKGWKDGVEQQQAFQTGPVPGECVQAPPLISWENAVQPTSTATWAPDQSLI